jgi:Pyruvate/2-oxoacid:ferredoxin oxidoreductase delta subunit
MKTLEELKFDKKALPLSKVTALDRSKWGKSIPKIDNTLARDMYTGTIACPDSAIEVTEGKMNIINNACTGCLICLRETPFNAVSEERVEK